MRYIKLFEYFKEDLRRFSEETLAYLLDDDSIILKIERSKLYRITEPKFDPYYKTHYKPRSVVNKENKALQEITSVDNRRCDTIILEKGVYKMRTHNYGVERVYIEMSFTWNSIKENMIPFIEMLDINYGIKDIIFLDKNDKVRGVRKDKIEEFDFEIKKIYISVKK